MRRQDGTTSLRFLALALLLGGLLVLSLHLGEEPAMAADADGDGLSDALEAVLGTDPNDSDSDDDSLDDLYEVFYLGTDPNLADTDCDSLADNNDPDPLDGGQGCGTTTADFAFDSNLHRSALTGSTPFEGFRVNAISGQLEMTLAKIDFGPGYRERNELTLTYFSGIEHNGPWGRNVICNWDYWVVEQQDDDVEVYMFGGKYLVDESSGTYTSPAGFPFTVTKDAQEDEITVTAIRGGKAWVFDATDGWLLEIADRFGNTTEIDRDMAGAIDTVTLPEGNEITFNQHATGRYMDAQDWGATQRAWTFSYNVCDQLAKVTDPEMDTKQVFYINGSDDDDLNSNLVRVLLGGSRDLVKVEYDTSDRVSQQTVAGEDATFSYTSTATTVTDFAGNQRVWNYSAGAIVPNSLVAYSNRDVRAGDPATWTTTFEHDSNLLRTEVVFPEGNRLDFEWDGNYCLTEKRFKATDTDTDSSTNDLIWEYTYGSTYHQLEDSTDPKGNTTERTLNGDELTTRIDFETITHPDPDVSIYETFTWNSNGQLVTHTDGEGAVTRCDYYSSGAKTGLLWKRTVDYGVSTLNLVTELDYSEYRYLTSKEDPDGNEWTYTTDSVGRRTNSTSPSPMGYETDYTWDSDGYLSQKDVENVDKTNTRVTANPWWTTTYTRDDLGRLTEVTEEIDASTTRTTSYILDGNGNVTLVTLPEGNEIQQVWDERGLLAERTRGYDSLDAATEEWEYDGNQNLTEFTDGREKVWEKSYDDFDRCTKNETPLGIYATSVLDKNGNVTEVKVYDAADTLVSHKKVTFDEINRPHKVEGWLDEEAPTADRWLATTVEYDARGRTVEVTNPRSNSWSSTWDAAGRMTEVKDPIGNKIAYSFTGDYKVPTLIQATEVIPGGGTYTFNTEQTTDALHRITVKSYVDLNDSQNKREFATKFASQNIPVELEDAKGNKTFFTLDGLGRITLKEVEVASVMETTYTWDKNGNLLELEDHNGNATGYTYNDRDLLTEVEYADAATRTLTYFDNDEVSGWIDENGTQVSVTLDDDSRVTSRSITRANGVLGVTSENLTWDAMNRLTEAKNTHSIVQNSFNSLGWLTLQLQGSNPLGQSGKPVTYDYNDDGSRKQVGFPSGTTLDITTNAIGFQTLIEDSNGNDLVKSTAYGPGLRYKDIEYFNGTKIDYGYDGFRHVSDIDHSDSQSTVFAGFDIKRDTMGLPTWVEFTHKSGTGHLFAYDMAGRMTAAQLWSTDPSAEAADSDWDDYTFSTLIEYDLDRVINRESVTHTAYGQQGVTTEYTNDEVNAYTYVGGNQRTHDDNGNLKDDGTLDFSYDYRNNLVMVEYGAGALGEYRFDAYNRRFEKSVNDSAATFRYIFDGPNVIAEYDENDNLLREFVYGQGANEVRVMIAADVADVDADEDTTEILNFYYHHDYNGSIVAITDPEENVVEQYEYTPFGVTTIEDGDGNNLSGFSALGNPNMYKSERFDEETGMYLSTSGSYDPGCGRLHQVRGVVGDFGLSGDNCPTGYRQNDIMAFVGCDWHAGGVAGARVGWAWGIHGALADLPLNVFLVIAAGQGFMVGWNAGGLPGAINGMMQALNFALAGYFMANGLPRPNSTNRGFGRYGREALGIDTNGGLPDRPYGIILRDLGPHGADKSFLLGIADWVFGEDPEATAKFLRDVYSALGLEVKEYTFRKAMQGDEYSVAGERSILFEQEFGNALVDPFCIAFAFDGHSGSESGWLQYEAFRISPNMIGSSGKKFEYFFLFACAGDKEIWGNCIADDAVFVSGPLGKGLVKGPTFTGQLRNGLSKVFGDGRGEISSSQLRWKLAQQLFFDR